MLVFILAFEKKKRNAWPVYRGSLFFGVVNTNCTSVLSEWNWTILSVFNAGIDGKFIIFLKESCSIIIHSH